MEIIVISAAAFLTAILTFFSGFGLGTILTPVMMLFFPVDLAIALTAIVHFFNNLFKLFLVGRAADKSVIIRFGIPAVLAAFLGSWVLLQISDAHTLFQYRLFGSVFEVSPTKLVIAVLLIIFSVMDLVPYFQKLQFGKEKLPIGGFLSGFFGGLAGIQGALRASFLVKAGLSKEAFIGTSVVVSTFVDFTRLGVYASRFNELALFGNIEVILAGTASAILGAFIGNKLLKKVTFRFLQITVGIMLLLLAIGLGAGWI
jgi:uncharacterized protein